MLQGRSWQASTHDFETNKDTFLLCYFIKRGDSRSAFLSVPKVPAAIRKHQLSFFSKWGRRQTRSKNSRTSPNSEHHGLSSAGHAALRPLCPAPTGTLESQKMGSWRCQPCRCHSPLGFASVLHAVGAGSEQGGARAGRRPSSPSSRSAHRLRHQSLHESGGVPWCERVCVE